MSDNPDKVGRRGRKGKGGSANPAYPPVSAQRSRIMAAIRSNDTKPELFLRSQLHRAGFRFRKASKKLPGKPDVVLPKYQAVVFMHGCFWHGHANCPHFRLPVTRAEFWRAKIERNRQRDQEVVTRLQAMDWRVFIVWECALAAKPATRAQQALAKLMLMLREGKPSAQLAPGKVKALPKSTPRKRKGR